MTESSFPRFWNSQLQCDGSDVFTYGATNKYYWFKENFLLCITVFGKLDTLLCRFGSLVIVSCFSVTRELFSTVVLHQLLFVQCWVRGLHWLSARAVFSVTVALSHRSGPRLYKTRCAVCCLHKHLHYWPCFWSGCWHDRKWKCLYQRQFGN